MRPHMRVRTLTYDQLHMRTAYLSNHRKSEKSMIPYALHNFFTIENLVADGY
jgi:hypothetical protein